MQRIVSHGRLNIIEEIRNLLSGLVLHLLEHFFNQMRLVAAAGFQNKFPRTGSLIAAAPAVAKRS